MAEHDAHGGGRAAPDAGSLRPGSELAGYRIESLLARGALSFVYLAEDARLKRTVALKILSLEPEHGRAFRDRFLRESELAASLDHANVLPIYEAGDSGGVLFVAMPYVAGSDLAAMLREGALAPERAIDLLAQVAAALDAAHEHGLVHGDVKPSDVLVDPSGHAYLADFGLTRGRNETAVSREGVQGSIDYVAPERIEGADADGRTDAYSLGCVLYECLVGEPPFARSSDVTTVFAHLALEPPNVPGLEDVFRKALAKNPHDRYASCAELVTAARNALAPAIS
jgi:serine/threonine protein kinase